jgi:hypothetical protein
LHLLVEAGQLPPLTAVVEWKVPGEESVLCLPRGYVVSFVTFNERGFSVPAGRFIRGVLLTVKFRQPSHEFTFGVGMNFISYPLVLTPLV